MMRDLKKKKSCEPGFCHNIPVGWGSWQSHDEGSEKEKKLRTRLLYQEFASISSAFHCERNKLGLLL
jgi:hypothetical protein